MSLSTSALAPQPTTALDGNKTSAIEIIVLHDQSLSGVLVWINIFLVVVVSSILLFEVVRRSRRYTHIYYTRSDISPEHAPKYPTALFGWIWQVFKTPDSYIHKDVGLDAFMLLSYLQMSFKFFSILAVFMIFILIPVNYYANSTESQSFNITTSETVLEVAAKSISYFSIDNVRDGSNMLWIHVACTYGASMLAYFFLYQSYKTYTASIVAFLSGKTPADPSQEVMFRTILMTNLPERLRHEHQLKLWLKSLNLGDIDSIFMAADDDANILKIIKRRDRNLRKLEKAYMTWAINLSKEFKHQRFSGIMGYCFRMSGCSPSQMSELHLQPMDVPKEKLTNEILQRTRPLRIRTVGGMIVRQDAIRAYDSKIRNMTENIIWARTKIVATSTLAREMPTIFNAHSSVLVANETKTAALFENTNFNGNSSEHEEADYMVNTNQSTAHKPNIPPEYKKRASITGSLAALTKIDMAIYKQFNACSCSAFVTFKDRRSAFCAQQLSLQETKDPFPIHIQAAPEPKEIIWKSLALSLMETVIKRGLVDIFVYTLSLCWIVPTSFVSKFSRLDELGLQPEYRQFVIFVNQYSWLRILVVSILPPLIIQLFNIIMPYVFDAFSGLQGYESTFKVQKATFAKYFFFLVFNVHFVFTIFSAAWGSSSNFFASPLAWVENIVTKLPSGTSFFINYLILNVILTPLELLRPVAYVITIWGRKWRTTPREYYELDIMASTLNYAFTYPPQILVFAIVLCYSIISPIVLIPGAIYFGATWLILKNQIMYVYVKKTEDYGRMWIMAYHRSVLGLGLFQFTTAGLMSAKKAPIAATVCGALVILTWFFYRTCQSLFEKHTRFAPIESLLVQNGVSSSVHKSDDVSAHCNLQGREMQDAGVLELNIPRSSLKSSCNLAATSSPSLVDDNPFGNQSVTEISTCDYSNQKATNVQNLQSLSPESANFDKPSKVSISISVPTPWYDHQQDDSERCLGKQKDNKDMITEIGLKRLSLTGPVFNAKDHQQQNYTLSYMSPAYSTPLAEPWIPEYISEIVKEYGNTQGPENIVSMHAAYPTRCQSMDSLV
ncbi:hypothetical protein O5D80_006711 [Batrachochytrium dendrobatidis]|nr:hypothetical protein O5D80_006711 [Batrachochytrium dendrobatidis]